MKDFFWLINTIIFKGPTIIAGVLLQYLGCVRVITDWYANKNINLHQYFALMNAFGGLKVF